LRTIVSIISTDGILASISAGILSGLCAKASSGARIAVVVNPIISLRDVLPMRS